MSTEIPPPPAENWSNITDLENAGLIDATHVHPAFRDAAWSSHLAYILEKMPEARMRGLQTIDMNRIFSLHPVPAHCLVRAAYITYQDEPVLLLCDAEAVLRQSTFRDFAKPNTPVTRTAARKFVQSFVEDTVIPQMIRNLERAHRRINEAFDYEELQRETRYGYQNWYKQRFDFIFEQAPPDDDG